MQMDLETLIELLKNFHEELTFCMEHKIEQGDPFKRSDPILLGSFVVDTYNNYLAAVKAIVDNPFIQAMPEIEPLDETDAIADEDERGRKHGHFQVGGNPRFQKMREVAFATKQLVTILKGLIKTEGVKAQNEIVAIVTLLDNLGEQIEEAKRAVKADPEGSGQSVQRLVEEYNRYLTTALEITEEDTVIAKMFHPLGTTVDETTSYHDKLSELRLAQSSLLSYLRKTHESAK